MEMNCPSQKRIYLTKSQAAKAAGAQGHRFYDCAHCPYWHTTKDHRGPKSKKIVKLSGKSLERIFDL